MEIGHNEIGDADAFDMVSIPDEISELVDFLCLPKLGNIQIMKLEYQVAQKLHGATEYRSKRAHDLIDLQLIFSQNEIDFSKTASVCRELFRYRRKQPWPSFVVKNDNWDVAYANQKDGLNVLPTVDDAIDWTNELIKRIENA